MKRKKKTTIKGNDKRLRLSVFRSNLHIFAQLIDDEKGMTVVDASSLKLGRNQSKLEQAQEVGKLLAKKALEKKVDLVVFDRGAYTYTGRVRALADAAREQGLQF